MDKAKDNKEEESEVAVAMPFVRKARKSQNEPEEEFVPLWLITFTDIMALMLTFFVLLYSMSVPVEEKWDDLTNGLNKGVSRFESPKWYQGPVDEINVERLDFSRALDLRYLKSVLEEIVADNETLKGVVFILQNDRLILSLPSDLLFEAGQSEVVTEGKRALFALGGPLSRVRNRIEIIGHADPRPIESGGAGYDSNWALSLARAANVAGVLENVGYTRTLIVRGLSSARYDQLPDDMDEEARMDLSRRVDIVIMEDDGSRRLLLQ
ncbi:MAG: OmpA family protein [Alphaproteobacteria bacterium]|nr:OmpA family protein [Alphaproteobacteria bacterium]